MFQVGLVFRAGFVTAHLKRRSQYDGVEAYGVD